MRETTEDFEYLLGIIERSHLFRRKQAYFAVLLLDKTDAEIAAIAAKIRNDEGAFEVFALNAISDSKIAAQEGGKEMFLTNEQLQLKNAMQEGNNQLASKPILRTREVSVITQA